MAGVQRERGLPQAEEDRPAQEGVLETQNTERLPSQEGLQEATLITDAQGAHEAHRAPEAHGEAPA